jgi:endonuclease III
MRRPYDPAKPDPHGIHAAVEQERLASRFRDRSSRQRVHPVQNDISRLVDFVAARRLRQPGVVDLLRRTLKHVDTDALRFLVSAVLDHGTCDRYMKRRCARLLGYCETIEAALMQKEKHDD